MNETCAKCSKGFRKISQGIKCSKCEKHFHQHCANLLTAELKNKVKENSWLCSFCSEKSIEVDQKSELDIAKSENELLRELLKQMQQSNELLKESKKNLEAKLKSLELKLSILQKENINSPLESCQENESDKKVISVLKSPKNQEGKLKRKIIILKKADIKPTSMKGVIPIKKLCSLSGAQIEAKRVKQEKAEVKSEEKATIETCNKIEIIEEVEKNIDAT